MVCNANVKHGLNFFGQILWKGRHSDRQVIQSWETLHEDVKEVLTACNRLRSICCTGFHGCSAATCCCSTVATSCCSAVHSEQCSSGGSNTGKARTRQTGNWWRADGTRWSHTVYCTWKGMGTIPVPIAGRTHYVYPVVLVLLSHVDTAVSDCNQQRHLQTTATFLSEQDYKLP